MGAEPRRVRVRHAAPDRSASSRITNTYRLDSAAGGFAVGDGAVWVAMYFDNTLERLDSHGRVLARIRVGLQPQFIHLAFGSVWVSNHHGRSLTRIDPRTNRVIATLPAGDQHMFRDGPQAMTDDGRYLYIYSSNGTRPLERIDPRTDAAAMFAAPVSSATSSRSPARCGPRTAAAQEPHRKPPSSTSSTRTPAPSSTR